MALFYFVFHHLLDLMKQQRFYIGSVFFVNEKYKRVAAASLQELSPLNGIHNLWNTFDYNQFKVIELRIFPNMVRIA